MIILAFLGVAFGYAVFYAGLTGFLALLSGGKIKKQTILGGLGVTGSGSLSSSLNLAQFNPFGASGIAKSETTAAAYAGSPGAYITPAEAPASFMTGNGTLGQSPLSGATALTPGAPSTPAPAPQTSPNGGISA
jgi:hypothetical protein